MAIVNRICENKTCLKPFEARSADVKRGWAKYCCKSCKASVQESKTGAYRSFHERQERAEAARELGYDSDSEAAGTMHSSGYFGHGQN